MKDIKESLVEKYDLREGSFTVTPQSRRHPSLVISGISEIFDFGTIITLGESYYLAEYLYRHQYCYEVLDKSEDYVVERVYLDSDR